MLPLLKICILLGAVILVQSVSKANRSENVHQSYFEKRKTILKNMKVTYIKRPKNSKVPKEYYANPQPYKHNFKILINEPNLCSQHEKVFLLFVIRSFSYDFSRRQIQRKIMLDIPNYVYSKNTVIKQIFLLAKPKNSTIESLIQKESKKYKDIIQEDCVESSTIVSLKTIMAWKWSVEFCSNADYVIVTKDEVFVDHYKLVQYLHYDMSFDKYDDRFPLCHLKINVKARRRRDMPMFYKGDYYPPFCDGSTIVAHINLINKLYIASQSNHYFMPDDSWIGLLAEKLNVSYVKKNYNYAFRCNVGIVSDPMYIFSELMFIIIKCRVVETLRNLSDIVATQRFLYINEMTETLPKQIKNDVKYETNYNNSTDKLHNLVQNLNIYTSLHVWICICMVFIFIIVYKSCCKFKIRKLKIFH